MSRRGTLEWPDETPPNMGFVCELMDDNGALLYPPCWSDDWPQIAEYLKCLLPLEHIYRLEWSEVARYERVCYVEPVDGRSGLKPRGRRFLRLRRFYPANIAVRGVERLIDVLYNWQPVAEADGMPELPEKGEAQSEMDLLTPSPYLNPR